MKAFRIFFPALAFFVFGCDMAQKGPEATVGSAAGLRAAVGTAEYSALAVEYEEKDYEAAADRVGRWFANEDFCAYATDTICGSGDLRGQCGSGLSGGRFAGQDYFDEMRAAMESGDYEKMIALMEEMRQSGNTKGRAGMDRLLGRMLGQNSSGGGMSGAGREPQW